MTTISSLNDKEHDPSEPMQEKGDCSSGTINLLEERTGSAETVPGVSFILVMPSQREVRSMLCSGFYKHNVGTNK